MLAHWTGVDFSYIFLSLRRRKKEKSKTGGMLNWFSWGERKQKLLCRIKIVFASVLRQKKKKKEPKRREVCEQKKEKEKRSFENKGNEEKYYRN